MKVDWAPTMEVTKEVASRPRRDSCMLTGVGDCRKGLDGFTIQPRSMSPLLQVSKSKKKYLSEKGKTNKAEIFPEAKLQQCRAMTE